MFTHGHEPDGKNELFSALVKEVLRIWLNSLIHFVTDCGFILHCGLDLNDADSVTQRETSLTEGEDIALNCTYSGNDHYLFWYGLYPGRQSDFAMQRYLSGVSENKADFAQNLFSVTVQQTEKFDRLTISDLVLSDTDVY
ncbi:hypothetical protein chiPu_0026390 [Chiloscyllium punctatum]|uniref:Immunoglobulin V-set domain-containing protein n=1 Tax=Chiloscyllium punctatum TaxID=137246 RepID=A0A401THT3_CHIPU|nr:hypothetical protein [Chiloscyllium punctatum]